MIVEYILYVGGRVVWGLHSSLNACFHPFSIKTQRTSDNDKSTILLLLHSLLNEKKPSLLMPDHWCKMLIARSYCPRLYSGVILMIRKYLFLYIFLRYINVWSTQHCFCSITKYGNEENKKNRKSETEPRICLCLKLGISSCLEFRN